MRKFGERAPADVASSDGGSKCRGSSQNSPGIASIRDVDITKLHPDEPHRSAERTATALPCGKETVYFHKTSINIRQCHLVYVKTTNYSYCPTARRKTLDRVAASRRVVERRQTGIKSTARFGE
ncbi:hypothetical protein AVEN_74234-1 [Araneus ventricosus]|uniref:Uncharacterized protein n=1 Tax=Araneus ventricosus TaxID=182803 RepID=A0A4Y2ESU2_ARAVE|nr:hypothetical protein AVEN_74234-1 [Araneus ventricosus]